MATKKTYDGKVLTGIKAKIMIDGKEIATATDVSYGSPIIGEKTKFILREGEIVPATLEEWAVWFETDERIIKQDHFDNITVSTVFLGDGTIMFESMILGGPFDQEQVRKRHKQDALRAHDKLLSMSGIIELRKLEDHRIDRFMKELETI